uniref:Helitron_like_N domain-containing protein n=1 Tax=Strongyloides papillosus TaxID=174720 RepID=A0A0N5BD38_STREA
MKDSVVARDVLEKRSIHRDQRTVNRLIGYYPHESGFCGVNINITRIFTVDNALNRRNMRIYIPSDADAIKNQNVVNPSRYAHLVRPNLFWRWLNNNINKETSLQRYRDLYKQTKDGKSVDKNRLCPGDLYGETTVDDYKDNLPLIGDEIQVPRKNCNVIS